VHAPVVVWELLLVLGREHRCDVLDVENQLL